MKSSGISCVLKQYRFVYRRQHTSRENPSLYIDSKKRAWRAFEYIQGEQFHTAADASQAGAVARCFALFTASFSNFNPALLRITIPGFHNLSERYKQFEKALKGRNYERLLNAANEINELKKRESYVNLYDVMTDSAEFKLRVMHHDAKVSNVLFDKKTHSVICPVDLDTVMAGLLFFGSG
jgi:Ser/Thr protein kinase RdoA (MazF antagonist)